MRVRQLDHVQLAMPVGREDEARAFYQRVLGIPEVTKPPHLAARGGCWFERGPLKVHLGVALGAGVGFGAISFGLAWIALRARRSKILIGPGAMLGHIAISRTPLSPGGQVEIRGELWQARLSGISYLPAGVAVRVKNIEELVLIVESSSNTV